MTTMMCFQAGGGRYCLAVQAARGVQRAERIVPLPGSATDVVGVIQGDPPLTVIAPLGAGGRQILVVEVGGKRFGLLVDVVTGLRQVAAGDIAAAPAGQRLDLISGTAESYGDLFLVVDPARLASRL
jgi:chemotaxis signal transduction protein